MTRVTVQGHGAGRAWPRGAEEVAVGIGDVPGGGPVVVASDVVGGQVEERRPYGVPADGDGCRHAGEDGSSRQDGQEEVGRPRPRAVSCPHGHVVRGNRL